MEACPGGHHSSAAPTTAIVPPGRGRRRRPEHLNQAAAGHRCWTPPPGALRRSPSTARGHARPEPAIACSCRRGIERCCRATAGGSPWPPPPITTAGHARPPTGAEHSATVTAHGRAPPIAHGATGCSAARHTSTPGHPPQSSSSCARGPSAPRHHLHLSSACRRRRTHHGRSDFRATSSVHAAASPSTSVADHRRRHCARRDVGHGDDTPRRAGTPPHDCPRYHGFQ